MNNESELQNLIRIGKVSAVNRATMTATVFYERQGIMSGELKILKQDRTVTVEGVIYKCAPWIPSPGQKVVTIHPPGGEGDGYILGGV